MSPFRPTLLSAAASTFLTCALAQPHLASAQLVVQATPFSVEIPTATLIAERPLNTLPLWLESVSMQHPKNGPATPNRSAVRFRVRKLSSLVQSVELRVTLAAGLGGQATVSAWTEAGVQKFQSEPFGNAESSQTEVLHIPSDGVDYIDLTLPRDINRLTGLFATAMKNSPVLHPIDFPPEPVVDGFTTSKTVDTNPDNDHLLMGRVAALIDAGPFEVEENKSTIVEFELSKPTTAAVLTYEIRSVLAGNPPYTFINNVELPAPSLILPDLADPAWRVKKSIGLPEGSLQYTGWIKVQQLLPKSALLSGPNQYSLQQPHFAGSAEVRNIKLQIRNLR